MTGSFAKRVVQPIMTGSSAKRVVQPTMTGSSYMCYDGCAVRNDWFRSFVGSEGKVFGKV